MVKRTSFIRYFYMAFALILLISCWEAQRNYAIVYASDMKVEGSDTGVAIPKESIRLRILANSDAPSDQWVKREVRDAIVEQMAVWVKGPQTIEEARAKVHEHLPELNQLVGTTLQKYGFTYSYQVELGTVPFPMKMYGNQIYPAGNYEALRVSIGEAEGQNWWCVLFPPLCFVDSEVIAKKTNVASAAAVESTSPYGQKNGEGKAVKSAVSSKADPGAKGQTQASMQEQTQMKAPQPEVRFFLWDMLKKLGSLFA